MTISIEPARSPSEHRAFYRFAWRVYRGDPNWVPPLWPQRKAYFEGRVPFFSFGEGAFWLARRGREIVGTIGTAINHSRNREIGLQAGTFGFFEVLPDDYEAAAALWDHACEWARVRGMTLLDGPGSFSADDEAGFLIQGHEYAPAIMMGHTPPYYAAFAERYGFQKLMDSMAYRFDVSAFDFNPANLPPVLDRIAGRVIRQFGPGVIRHPEMAEWDQLVEKLHQVYNRSLASLTNFAPVELAEFRARAEDLRPILDPELIFIAEVKGRVAGFTLGLPNLTEALKHANGLRYPWDYARLLWARRRIRSVSFKIMAMDPDFWGLGIDALMIREMSHAIMRKGYTWVDASLTGEGNPQTHRIIARFGGYVYRRYRQYRLLL